MERLPRIPVAHTRTVQRLPATPETHAGGIRRGIEVAGQHDVNGSIADPVLDESRACDRLQLTLVLEVQLEVRVVGREQQRPDRFGRGDLGDQGRAWELARTRSDVLIDFAHLVERPAACDRGA
jgi:hypothetical protein